MASQNNAPRRPTVGVIIRFKNSAATLPGVLAGLRRQTRQPDLILGVDNQSTDDSPRLLREAGVQVIEWTEPYRHPQVVNFAVRHCPADLGLVLSSHTVLQAPDTLEKMVAAMADPATACVSGKWDDDGFYSDAIDWAELRAKGLKFCAIYSNSMGMFRRSLWEQAPFDEAMPTMEDGAWAVEQVRRGKLCRRLDFPFSYQRGGRSRHFIFAVLTFQMAARHGLRVAWLGPAASVRQLLGHAARRLFGRGRGELPDVDRLWQNFRAWLAWRHAAPEKE